MPLEYAGGGVLKEHAAVREAVGRLRRLAPGQGARTRGRARPDFVNRCLTNDLDRIGPGKAQYTLCCDERPAAWSTTSSPTCTPTTTSS